MRIVPLVCLSFLALSATAGSAMASPIEELGDSTRVYTFNDLTVACGWGTTSSGLYEDLVFPSSTYMARCNTTNGTVGLVPSAIAGGRVEVRVQLPGPASAVSIESYMYQVGDEPTLIAYDENGVELGRSSDGTMGQWVTLEVVATEETPIAEIGLYMPQVVNYLDNLTVNYGWAATQPEDDPEPLPLPQEGADPVALADCTQGGWMAFGFRNQGQCVSYVRNGRDSR